MPSEASIYGMIRPQPITPLVDPQERQMRQMRLRQLMGAEEMQNLQLGETRRGIETGRRIQDLFAANPNAGPDQVAPIDYRAAQKLREDQLKARQTAAATGKTEAEASALIAKQGRDLIAAATPETLPAVLEWGVKNNQQWALRAPAQIMSDPAAFASWQKQNVLGADEWLKRNAPTLAETETGRHNLAQEGTAAANLRVSQGNLAETRANNQRPVFDSVRGVFATRPDQAGASRVIAPAGMPQSPQQVQSLREDTDKLRQEFENKPAVKQYRDVLPIVASAKQAPDTRAGDIQMAYAVGKILDPNSVVREGELKLVGNAATVMQQVEGELRTLTQGKGRLTPQTRAQLNAMLENAVNNRKASFDAEKGSYGGIVERRGYKPEDVFIDTPAPVAPKAPAQGKPTRISGDDGYNALPKGALYVGPDGVTRRK